jgi:predicted MFS family arabinose efflux permease
LAIDTSPLRATDIENSTSAVTRWYVLIMMCVVYTLSIADRYATQQVLDPIRIEMHLTDLQVSLATGLALACFYVVFGFPISWLIDRYSRRWIVGLSMIAWSAMTTLTGVARIPWQFVLARIGVGIGEAGGTPGANSLLSDYFPIARRPMALTIFSLGAPIGSWIATTIVGWLYDRYGWHAVFMIMGVPGVIAGLLVIFTVGEPRRGQLDLNCEGHAPSFFATMKFLWTQRSAVHIMVGSALTALWGWGLMAWTPAFLQRSYHLTPGESGAILGDMNLWGGSLATVLTGWLMGRSWFSHPCRIARLLGLWIGLATFASIGVYWTHSLLVAKICLWIFVPSIYFYIGPCFGMLNNLSQPRMRAMFCASTLFVANVGNLVIAPPLIGFLSDHFAPASGPTAESLRLALLCVAPVGFWSAAHYFLSLKRLVCDQERATGVRV